MSEKKLTGLAARLANKTADIGKDPQPRTTSERGPVTMPGQLGAFRLEAQRYQDQIKDLEAQLEAAKAAGGALDIPLERLIEAPGRRRKLSQQAFNELKNNLAKHELVHPITVRPKESGDFEIVSGHNRVAAYRDLGKETIKAWPADYGEEKVDELAFYANLLAPELTAWEKYQGLKAILAKEPDLTVTTLASRTGLAISMVSELLAFDNLPAPARELLATKPTALGSRAAYQLANMALEGRYDQVVEAVRKAVEEGAEQQEVVRLAASDPKPATVPKPERAAPVMVKAGRRNYCSMVGAKNTLRLQFQSEEERREVEEEVRAILERRARQKAG